MAENLFEATIDGLYEMAIDTLFDLPLDGGAVGCGGKCLFDTTIDGLYDMSLDALFDLPLDCVATLPTVSCTWTQTTVQTVLTTLGEIVSRLPSGDEKLATAADILSLSEKLEALMAAVTALGSFPTVKEIQDGLATPADVKLTTTTQTVNVTQETVNVTTQIVDLSAMENTLAAMKEKMDTLPENPVEVVTQTVNVTQETVNVSTQVVDLSGVTETLGLIKTSTDRIPTAPAAAGNIPTVSDIASAVGRRQIEKNPPLLSMDGLVLAALSSVTEPNVGNPAAGTLRVKNPDGSTLGTLTLGVENASTAKVITGVTP
jgi:hypothetical protein